MSESEGARLGSLLVMIEANLPLAWTLHSTYHAGTYHSVKLELNDRKVAYSAEGTGKSWAEAFEAALTVTARFRNG